MKHFRRYATWGLAIVAVLLSPVILILSLIVTIGIGLDVIDATGSWPIALLLCTPTAYMLLRPMLPGGLTHRLVPALAQVRRPVRRAARLDYAP